MTSCRHRDARRRLLVGALGGVAWPALIAAQQPLQVAFVYLGPVGDAGWTFAHDAARRAIERSFGERIRVTAVPSVQEGADAERVLRDLVAQGHRLIFATSFGYMEPALRVAADHPEVKFEHATGFKTAPNMRTYDTRSYEPAYLAGMVAGGSTRSGVLGVVGAFPVPAVLMGINALTLGALAVNPAVRTRVVWIHEWFNPPRETEAAQSLIHLGADVLMQTTDSPAVLQQAERSGVQAFGLSSDMSRFAPKAHLGSIVNDWAPYCTKAVADVLEGRWATGHAWWGIREGAAHLVGVPSRVPAALRARVDATRNGLRDGSFAIWKGPLHDNDGRQVLAPGQIADDAFLRGINFYVQGVEGRVPS
ncbi:MAG: BMP family ABC transporter substrate-binding protein [Burkholderiaceae bacterium]|nr:BMP family ABC transporter substrate-binding protein [Burkholderiaceae bacterium]